MLNNLIDCLESLPPREETASLHWMKGIIAEYLRSKEREVQNEMGNRLTNLSEQWAIFPAWALYTVFILFQTA